MYFLTYLNILFVDFDEAFLWGGGTKSLSKKIGFGVILSVGR